MRPDYLFSDVSRNRRSIDGLLIEKNASNLIITRNWSKNSGYATLIWIAVWVGLVTFFTSLGHQPIDMSIIIPYLPAIAMGYVAMTRFLNRTVIDVGPSQMTLRHMPIPWLGNKRYAIKDITGLHAETRRIYAKGHTVDECWLLIVRQGGKKSLLLKGLEMSELQLSYIAAALSEYLDVPLTAGRR